MILDIGHAILAYENAAESFALTRMFGDRLFLLHINDTRPDWDWDLNVGVGALPGYAGMALLGG